LENGAAPTETQTWHPHRETSRTSSQATTECVKVYWQFILIWLSGHLLATACWIHCLSCSCIPTDRCMDGSCRASWHACHADLSFFAPPSTNAKQAKTQHSNRSTCGTVFWTWFYSHSLVLVHDYANLGFADQCKFHESQPPHNPNQDSFKS
jgi:hypothetical protein